MSLALFIQHAMRMRLILSSVACLSVPYFFLLRFSETFLFVTRTERDVTENARWSSCTIPVINVRCEWNLNLTDFFRIKYSNIKFHENPSSDSLVVPRGKKDGRTDMA